MTAADALDLLRDAVWTVLVACGPTVIAAMIVGIFIAVLQALTQVQEMTLTFVPKIITIFIVSIATAHFVGSQVMTFALALYERIETGF